MKIRAEHPYPSLVKTLSDENISRRVIFEKGNVFKDEKGFEHYPLFASAFLFPENGKKIDDAAFEDLLGDPFDN